MPNTRPSQDNALSGICEQCDAALPAGYQLHECPDKMASQWPNPELCNCCSLCVEQCTYESKH
jgi:hypothetical protein